MQDLGLLETKNLLNKLRLVRVANFKLKSFYLDLKAFERRLTEYIHCLQPATWPLEK